VADLDAPVDGEGGPAAGAGVAGTDLGGGDGPVGLEVPAAHHVDGVAAVLVRTRHPGAAPHHERVDQVADAEVAQRLGADVAPHQPGVLVEAVERRHLGRLDVGAQALQVDLTVAGHADHEQLLQAVGLAQRDHDVLERRGGVDVEALRAEPGDEGVDRRAVWRVEHLQGGCVEGSCSGAAGTSAASVLAA
jgi:hypothetical protein